MGIEVVVVVVDGEKTKDRLRQTIAATWQNLIKLSPPKLIRSSSSAII